MAKGKFRRNFKKDVSNENKIDDIEVVQTIEVEGKKSLNFSIPLSMHNRLKEDSKQMGISIADIVRLALSEYYDKRSK